MKEVLSSLVETEIELDDSGLSIQQKNDFCEDGYVFIPTQYIDLFIEKLLKVKGSNHGR